ncbi:uncharacterized protein [Manis javanica]|uniref:uncharacterized protein n=1 Tax=Manis javanica TaxID=9974 RepID=UPI00187A1947|nr:serine/arginine repetitive matrix protein 1-like [Manis javanica]
MRTRASPLGPSLSYRRLTFFPSTNSPQPPLGPKTRASCSPDLGPPSSRTRLLPPPAPQSSGVTNGHRVISRRICWKRGPGCFPGTEVTPPSRGGSSQQAFPSRASVGTAATPLAVAAHLPAPQPATLSRPRREGHGMAPRPPFPRAQAERGGAGRSPQPRLTRAPRWLQPRSQLASSGPEAGSRAGSSNYVARAGDRPQKYSAKKMKSVLYGSSRSEDS